MQLPPRLKRLVWAAPLIVLLLLPGWAAELKPVAHEILLRRVQRADNVVGVRRAVDGDPGEWQATYADSVTASALSALNLRGMTTYVAPPLYVAYIPEGARLGEYFRVETHLHWPWWLPGGGVQWKLPN